MTDGGLPRQRPPCATLPAGGQYQGALEGGHLAFGSASVCRPCTATLLHACCHSSYSWNSRTTLALINTGGSLSIGAAHAIAAQAEEETGEARRPSRRPRESGSPGSPGDPKGTDLGRYLSVPYCVPLSRRWT